MNTIQQKLDNEYEKDKDMRDMQYIGNLEAQLSFMRTAIPAYTTEFQKLCEKKDSVTKSLKATRDQRVKRIEDSKTSWIGVIRALEDAELRDRVGDEVELMKIAKDRAYDRLGQNHQYMDNKVENSRKKTGGRKPGVPNKATQEAREAIKALLDANIPYIQSWLTSTAEGIYDDDSQKWLVQPNPAKACEIVQNLVEYSVPKLARTELVGDKNAPQHITISWADES